MAVLAVALGYGASWLRRDTATTQDIERALAQQARQTAALQAQLAAIQDQLRAQHTWRDADSVASRSEPPAQAEPPIAAAAVQAPAAAAPDNPETLKRGQAILDRAIADHRWGGAEIAALRQAMTEMTNPQQLAIMQALAAALNRGDIKGTISSLLVD